ncbi:HEPN domain-containing protein [Rheinheimera soli]|uniref:Apea-like HEPN domain-containing protein n=1 Tax=Rheinheimera soli TaxID=443616 RepID=A0ABU1W5M6_9GAMM|nr:HEPN domain-containing protein [Rheinheimera soli]MDR7123130.1 hypothetical protein [Rheinheimera soli]
MARLNNEKLVQISAPCYDNISTLLEELYSAYLGFQDNPAEYAKRRSSYGLPLGTISAPSDMIESMSEKLRKAEHCIFQIHCTDKSSQLVTQISETIRRSNNLNCIISELKPIIEASIYEYVNARLEQLLQSDATQESPFELDKDTFSSVLNRRIQMFKRMFSKRIFEFPVVAFQLNNEIQLSSNISLIKNTPDRLNHVDCQFMDRFNESRLYDINFYLRVSIPIKSSYEYSRKLSKRVEGAMIGCINLVTSYQNYRTVSLISADERANHLSHFFRYGSDIDNMDVAKSYVFPTQIPKDDSLWSDLIESNKTPESLANWILNVPQLMIELSGSKHLLIERVERSLKWFRDAVNEADMQIRIQKIVTSIEALVNFSDKDTTESFIRRIVKLHSSEIECVDSVESRARELYKSRSNIVHGSSLVERLSFDLVDFSSKCLVLGIICYSMYGLSQPKDSKKLKAWLDSPVVKTDESAGS